MMRRTILRVMLLTVVLSACGAAPTPAPNVPENILTWDKDPNAIIFRIDREWSTDSREDALNRVPLCTIYGNGHIVWVNVVPPNGEEILEAFIDDVTFRGFLDFLIRDLKYYSIPDYAARQQPSPSTPTLETISLILAGTPQTIRSYSAWENDAYAQMLARCTTLSSTPAQFAPTGGWLSVLAVENNGAPSLLWPVRAAVELDKATGAQPVWISGEIVQKIWATQRETRGNVLWVERDRFYRIVLQVPGISRDSPPAPAQ